MSHSQHVTDRADAEAPWISRALIGVFIGVLTLCGLLEVWGAVFHGSYRYSERDSLEQHGVLSRALRPVQVLLATKLRMTTASVVTTSTGWHFLTDDLAHVAGRGFLDSSELASKRAENHDRDPDPIAAITDLSQQLRSRGVRLIILPVPAKASWEHCRLVSADGGTPALSIPENPSTRKFLSTLRSHGIDVVNAAQVFADAATFQERAQDSTEIQNDSLANESEPQSRQVADTWGSSQPLYLREDTHWSPFAVDMVARVLANGSLHSLKNSTQIDAFVERIEQRSGVGDLRRRLAPWDNATESCQVVVADRQISERSSENSDHALDSNETSTHLIGSRDRAPILILGDSYSRIFGDEALGFGTGADLRDRLERHTGQPIDRIAINQGGSLACRSEFIRTWQRDPERFSRLQVVVWEFTMRELSTGDWTPLSLPSRPPNSETPRRNDNATADLRNTRESRTRTQAEPAASWQPIRGKILAIAPVSELARETPYQEALLAFHVELLSTNNGTLSRREVVCYGWGKRVRRLTSLANLQVGSVADLQVLPWDTVERQLERVARVELEELDDRLLALPVLMVKPVDGNAKDYLIAPTSSDPRDAR